MGGPFREIICAVNFCSKEEPKYYSKMKFWLRGVIDVEELEDCTFDTNISAKSKPYNDT